MSERNTCKNCNEEFSQNDTYCPHCGQKVADSLTFAVLFSKLIENYFSIDGRFFKSLLILLTRPGVIARRFVDGQRQKYLHPARFYLFVSLVFFFIFSFSIRNVDNKFSALLQDSFEEEVNTDSLAVAIDSINQEFEENVIPPNSIQITEDNDVELIATEGAENMDSNISFSFDRALLDSLIEMDATLDEKYKAMGMSDNPSSISRKFYAQLLKFYENQGVGILKVLYEMIPLVMFLLLPLFALLLNVFLWKKSTFAHHLVFSLYFFTFIFMSLSILVMLNRVLEIPTGINALISFSFLLYLIIAIKHFYQKSWISCIIKANIISFLYFIIGIPLAAVGVLLAGFMLY